MTSMEEALRSGAVRLVPVEATDDMTAAWPSYNKGAGHERSIYNAMLSAAPDHTPALLALIEERDRLKVERDARVSFKEFQERTELGAAWQARALAAEAKCDALREALKKLLGAAVLLAGQAEGCIVSHHSKDHSAHGLPGWYRDCVADIAAARALAAEAASASKDERIRELEAHLAHYADQLCELGPHHECCGKLSDDECAGCRARSTKEPT